MSNSRFFGAAVLCAARLTVSTAPAWAVNYTITGLGTLGGTDSRDTGINDVG